MSRSSKIGKKDYKLVRIDKEAWLQLQFLAIDSEVTIQEIINSFVKEEIVRYRRLRNLA